MERIKVLIADDHKIIRVGLRGILDKTNEVEVVAEAEDGIGVLETLKSIVTDVVLMDIDMGRTSGIETTRKVKEAFPDVHVLALTMHEEQDNIIQMLDTF